MSSARQIREDLYCITWNFKSWGVSELRNATSASRGQALVENLPEIFGSCLLNYELDEIGEKLILEMEMEPVFSEVITPSKLNAVLVLASHSGIQQQMTLSQSKTKWVTCFSVNYGTVDHGYDYTEESIGFDILFDFNPDGASTLKRRSQFVHNTLLNLWESKTLTDVTFKCQGKNFTAHANILASSSPVLAAMFLNDFKEKRDRVVEITDFDARVFENLLRYLYTGELFGENNRPAIKHVENLFAAADKYDIGSLKEECEIHLSKNLTVGNMTRYLVLAHRHSSSKLSESTLDFMAENAGKTVCSRRKTDWMEIIKPYPELAFQVMERLAGNQERRGKKRTHQSMVN